MELFSHLLTTYVVRNSVACGGTLQTFAQFPARRVADGLVLSDDEGGELLVVTDDTSGEHHLIVQYLQEIKKKSQGGAFKVSDPILAKRIAEYLLLYYGRARTNCAALAHYLKTGVFVPSGYSSHHAFVLSGAFDVYHGQEIHPGDIICLLYYDEAVRKNEELKTLHARYDECMMHGGDDWGRVKGGPVQVSVTEICEQYDLGIYADFHFMTCLGYHNQEPVFLQQMGMHDPASGNSVVHAPIVVSAGTVSVSQHVPVAFSFIQQQGNRS